MAFILRQVNITSAPAVEQKNSHSGNDKDKEMRLAGLKSLTRQGFEMLVERYRDDYELFDMPIPTYEQIQQQLIHNDSV